MFGILTAHRPARHEWTRIRGMEARRQGYLRYPYDALLIGKGPEIDAIDWTKEDPDIPRMGINEAALLVPGVSYAVASDVGAVQRVGQALRKRKQPVVFFPQWDPDHPVKLRGGRVIHWQRVPIHEQHEPRAGKLFTGRSTTAAALAILAWMGVKRVELIGCNATPGITRWVHPAAATPDRYRVIRDMLRVHARRLGLMLIWRMPDGYRDANERENERERDYQKRQQEKANKA